MLRMGFPQRTGGYAAENDACGFALVVRDDAAVPNLPVPRVVTGLRGRRPVKSGTCRVRIHRTCVALIALAPFLIVVLVFPYLAQPLGRMRQQRLYIVLQKKALEERAAKRLEPGAGVVERSGEIPGIGCPQAERDDPRIEGVIGPIGSAILVLVSVGRNHDAAKSRCAGIHLAQHVIPTAWSRPARGAVQEVRASSARELVRGRFRTPFADARIAKHNYVLGIGGAPPGPPPYPLSPSGVRTPPPPAPRHI